MLLHFKYNDVDKLKVKWWGKKYYANTNQKKISGYINIRQNRIQEKKTIRDKKEYYIMIKESTHWEDIATLNAYVYITELQNSWSMSWLVTEERDKYTIVVGDYTPLLAIDSTSKPKKKNKTKQQEHRRPKQYYQSIWPTEHS